MELGDGRADAVTPLHFGAPGQYHMFLLKVVSDIPDGALFQAPDNSIGIMLERVPPDAPDVGEQRPYIVLRPGNMSGHKQGDVTRLGIFQPVLAIGMLSINPQGNGSLVFDVKGFPE